MYLSKIDISTYIAKYRWIIFLLLWIEEKIAISILEAKIEMSWSDFASKYYYKDRNRGGTEMI